MRLAQPLAVSAGILVVALLGSASQASAQVRTGQPAAGISIVRILADPPKVSDARGEWFEIRNLGTRSVSLLGWRIASGHDRGHLIGRAVIVPPAGRVVLGRDANRARNGGARVDYAFGSSISLANARDWLALRDPRGVTIDSVAWTTTSGGFARIRAAQPAARGATPNGASPNEVVVRVLDVGQGDASLITNGGSTVLIDGGPDVARFGFLLDSLGLDGSTIDAVILSHEHYDHYAGLRELFRTSRHMTVRYFFENQDAYANAALRELRDSIASRAVTGQLTYRDTDDPCGDGRAICTIAMRGGARLHVMRPDPTAADPNDRSAPVKLVGPDSASFTMWFSGDAMQEAIGWFESARYDVTPGMRVDVLKADHHGSCNGVSRWYLRTTRPTWVAVSVGNDNSYGHMHEQAKSLYRAYGIPWYRTDRNGSIVFRSAGTPGAGYTVMVSKGSASMDGGADRRSTQPACAAMP
jgi:competence protein ComEC